MIDHTGLIENPSRQALRWTYTVITDSALPSHKTVLETPYLQLLQQEDGVKN